MPSFHFNGGEGATKGGKTLTGVVVAIGGAIGGTLMPCAGPILLT